MKLAAWKYFSVIMALLLVLGTGATALDPMPIAAATTPPHRSHHATENVTDRHSPHLTATSDNRALHFPALSQYTSSAGRYAAGAGCGWYVNGALGTDDGTHGSSSGAGAFKTIQYALDAASSGDTINIAGLAQYIPDSYEEVLTISKSISLVGDGADTTDLWNNESHSTISLSGSGLDVSMSGMYIHHHNAHSINGGAISAADSTLTLNNIDLWGEGDEGGGIYVDNCTLLANDSWISGSAHNNGGGLNALDSDVTLNRCILWGPDANSNGGGLYAYSSDVNMTDCYFIDGEAGAGGAIYVNSSVLTALRCSFNGDWEGINGDGQGVYVNAVDDNCTVDISNCTFSQNYLDTGDGGGIYVESQNEYSADVTLTCCTFFANEVYGYGGGLYQVGDNSTTTVRNCIFDNWADEDGDSIYVDGGIVNSSYSLYSDTPDLTSSDNDITGADSLCYSMADNGGLTPTCAIDSTSPARGAGSTVLATDQRGVTRGSPSDIGAYQWVGPDTYANDLTGNDANSGLSAGAPKKHIYAATNLAGPGSTTHVAAGTYDEENHWDVYDLEYYNIGITKPLTLIGAGAASTSIDGSYPVYENWGPIIDVYDVTEALDDATVSISGLTLKNATDEDEENEGGGLAIWDGNATVQNCVIENNYAYYGGGGIYIEDAGEVALLGCTIRNNSANDDGGGILSYGTENVTISDCEINGNEALDGGGGGIYTSYCYIFDLLGSTINGNSASEDGGGIYGDSMYGYNEAESYDTLISRCTIDDNTADGNGGGIYLYSVDDTDYPVRVQACTLSNNQADGDSGGGGLYNYDGSFVQLTNCTIYGNILPDGAYGGGIDNAGYAELLNCTIASNDAGTTGIGGGYYQEGWGTFENTILANNAAAGGPDISGNAGRFTSEGHNICMTDGSNDYFNGAGDRVDTDPGLGPLQDNSGPTFTCAIGATSPAYDGTDENAPWFDQREVARPQNTYWDIGAYEYDGAAPSGPTVTAITPSSGANTGSVSITNLAGTNFASGATVKLTKSGQADISGGSVAFVNSTRLTCTFPLTGAATGTWNVVVTNPDAQSGTLINGFTVTAPAAAPTVSAISPDSGMWGETLTVTITGANFTGATAVSFGPGITVTFTVVSPTQINATINIAMGATTGARNISVTTPQGTGINSFTVNPNFIGTQSHGGGGGSNAGSTGQGNQGMTPVSMPNIVVQSATISNARVAPGETVTITANLANKGTVNGTSAVKMYVNGQEEAIQGVTVNGGSNRPISFTLSRNEPGTYIVYVGGTQAGSFTVESFRDSDLILWLSMACVLAAFILGAVMLWRRQRNYY